MNGGGQLQIERITKYCAIWSLVGRISLAQALRPDRQPTERLAFLAAVEDGLSARMVNHPVPADNLVRIIVLAKRGSE